MTFEIRRIPLWPVVKIFFVIYFVIIFLISLIYGSLLLNIVAGFGEMASEYGLPSFGAFGVTGIVMLGLMAAFFGSIINTLVTVVVVIVYNAIASFTGGVELSTESGEWETAQARMIRLEEAFATHSTKESEAVDETSVEPSPDPVNPQEQDPEDDLRRFQPPDVNGDISDTSE